MQPKRTALLLSTLCLATSACHTAHTVDFIATPADRLVCEAAGARPKIPAEYVIDWTKVASVSQAKAEHEKFVAIVRTREGIVAAYILSVEGKLYVCGANMAWRRDWETELAKTHKPGQ